MNDYLPKIKKIISEHFGVQEDLVTSNANLEMDLNLSSIEITDLVSLINQNFGITLPDDIEISSIKTIEDLVELIAQNSEDL